jgi:spore germination cell wall hydrolase CwlJ-like protein
MLEAAIMCLALNVYNESRGEDFKGQVAVAQVTMNRADHDPKRVCKAVYAKHQFSWTDQKPPPPKAGEEWNKARMVAILSLHKVVADPTNGSTHYHERHAHPRWRKFLARTAVIGRHIFYREK